jgi:hypothetical protein
VEIKCQLGFSVQRSAVTYEKVVTAVNNVSKQNACAAWSLRYSRHAGLAGDTSGDDDNVGTGKGLLGTVVGGEEAGNLGGGVDVREVGSNLDGMSAKSVGRNVGRQRRAPWRAGKRETGGISHPEWAMLQSGWCVRGEPHVANRTSPG